VRAQFPKAKNQNRASQRLLPRPQVCPNGVGSPVSPLSVALNQEKLLLPPRRRPAIRRKRQGDLTSERGEGQREGGRERERERDASAPRTPPRPQLYHPSGGPSSPARRERRAARHERVTEDREGQTRGPPEVAEHRRTSVRIAAPASVLKPRPRFTVHDISGLCRGAAHFFAHPGPGGRTWRVKHGGGRARARG